MYALQLPALAVVSVRAFRIVDHALVRDIIVFLCLVFRKKFNILSAHFVHRLFTLPQKNDSRGGWSWFKRGEVVNVVKMNFYLKQLPFVPAFGLFAAKRTAIWCKTQCVLMLNAVRFGAKCNAFWC